MDILLPQQEQSSAPARQFSLFYPNLREMAIANPVGSGVEIVLYSVDII